MSKVIRQFFTISGVFWLGVLIAADAGASKNAGMAKAGMIVMAIGAGIFIMNLPHLQQAYKDSKKQAPRAMSVSDALYEELHAKTDEELRWIEKANKSPEVEAVLARIRAERSE